MQDDFAIAFQKQVEKGKSECYARQYAQKCVEGYSDVYAYWFAFAYESALKEGQNEQYCEVYADKLAYEFSEQVGYTSFPEDETFLQGLNTKILAYMLAWEALGQTTEFQSELAACEQEAYKLFLKHARNNRMVSLAELKNLVKEHCDLKK